MNKKGNGKMKRKIYFWLIALAVLIIAIMPQAAFAGTEDDAASNAIAGTIALVNWDEDGAEYYDTSGKVTLQVGAGEYFEWFVIGTGTGDSFQPLSGSAGSCTISVKKDDWSETVTRENPGEMDPLYEGAFLGYYNESEEGMQLGYNGDAILLGEDTYGTYNITVTWEKDGATYTGAISMVLEKNKKLARGSFGEPEQYEENQGFLRHWYGWGETGKNQQGQFQLYYEPYYDYTEAYTALYTDGDNGILSFVDSDCGVSGLFETGEAVEYKKNLQVIPLQIDYSKITADMVGKAYTLKFIDAKGNYVTCEVVIAYKNELSYLQDGQVYAIDSGKVKDDGKLYIANQDELLQSLVKEKIEADVMQEMELTRYHFGVWDATNKNFTPVTISCSDPAVEINGNKGDGYILYATVETSGNFTTENEKTIAYSFSLPESGFYRAPVRSVENYLGYKAYLAEEDVSDNGYDFYYMVQADATFKKTDLRVEHIELNGVTVEGTDDWTDIASGKAYYVWHIHMDSHVINDTAFDEEIWLDVSAEKNGQDFGAYDWIDIYGTNAVPESQQLYWFNPFVIGEIGENGEMRLNKEYPGTLYHYKQKNLIYEDKTSKREGYFAIKKGTEYYAVKNAEVAEATGVSLTSSSDNPYLYTVEWTEFGEYQITATVDEQTYRYNLTVELPEVGFYSTSTRSEKTYLDDGFHYVNAAEKNDDGTEAYFYLIAPTCGHDEKEITMAFGSWTWNDETKVSEWHEKTIAGLSIDNLGAKTFGGEQYVVWKIMVSNEYSNKLEREQAVKITYGKDSNYNNAYICIYDSTEIPEEEQLYWIYESASITIDEEGKICLKEGTGDSLDTRANKKSTDTRKTGEMYGGYFAIKKGTEYYAVEGAEVAQATGASLTRSSGNQYLYTVEWTEFGEYQIVATVDGQTYRYNITVTLPKVGFYSSSTRSEKTYLDDEFHYVSAAEKNDDRTEAYFYLIAPAYDFDAQQIKLSFVDWNQNEQEWQDRAVAGISIGKPTIEELSGEKYAIWKISVENTYRNPYDEWKYLSVAYDEDERRIGSLRIYDSTEIPEEEQLYWIYESASITIDEEGKICLKEGTGGSLDTGANKKSTNTRKTGAMYGYFAIKKDGEYYAVEGAKVAEATGASLTSSSDDPYLYTVKWTEFGEYQITATAGGKTYRYNLTVELPEVGFYSTSTRNEKTYLDEFYYVNAAEKSEDGSKAYFYLIAPSEGDSAEKIEVSIGNNSWSEEETYEWVEKNIDGITIGTVEIKEMDGESYAVCKITVADTYEGNIYRQFRIKYGDNYRIYRSIGINDASEIPENAQLYYFWDYNIEVNEDGKIQLKEDYGYVIDDLANSWITSDNRTGKKISIYFAVKIDGEYYVVDDPRISGDDNVKIKKDKSDSRTYTVEWTELGKSCIAAKYDGIEYYMNVTIELPQIGFYSTSERSGETYLKAYLDKFEFHYIDAAEKSVSGDEAYFYLIALSGNCSADQIKVTVCEREWDEENQESVWKEKNVEGLTVGSPEIKMIDGIPYVVCRIAVSDQYTYDEEKSYMEEIRIIYNYQEDWYSRGEAYIIIHDAKEIPKSQQLYWFKGSSVRNNQGIMEVAEDVGVGIEGMAFTQNDIVYGAVNTGYFAILKDDEYHVVENVSTEGVSATFDENTGAFTLKALHVGEYTISYNDGEKNYYFRDNVNLPGAGCFTSKAYTEESCMGEADMFDYNTADENKHFYVIASENFIVNNYTSNPTDVIVEVKPYGSHDGNGISIGESGTFEENGGTYYYWEIKVDKSFQHNSDSVQYAVEIKNEKRGDILWGRYLNIRGYVKYGDVDGSGMVDFADALYLKRYLANWNKYNLTKKVIADLNADGIIDNKDVMILERHIAGWTDYATLPMPKVS